MSNILHGRGQARPYGYPMDVGKRQAIRGYDGGFQNRGGGGLGGNTGFATLPNLNFDNQWVKVTNEYGGTVWVERVNQPHHRMEGDPPDLAVAPSAPPAGSGLSMTEVQVLGGVTLFTAVGAGLGHLAAGAAGSMIGAGLGFLLPVFLIRRFAGFSK